MDKMRMKCSLRFCKIKLYDLPTAGRKKRGMKHVLAWSVPL